VGALVVCCATGCASAPASFATTQEWPASRRSPDGVAIDPEPAPIAGVHQARTTAGSVVALTPSASLGAAVEAVMRFVDAVTREDAALLATVLGERAGWINPAAGRSGSNAVLVWRERFRRLEYGKLAGAPVVRESDVEIYAFDDLEAPLPGRPQRPPEMRDGDVYARARVLSPRVGPDRLFGDELGFVLRSEGDRFRIVLLLEEFQIP